MKGTGTIRTLIAGVAIAVVGACRVTLPRRRREDPYKSRHLPEQDQHLRERDPFESPSRIRMVRA